MARRGSAIVGIVQKNDQLKHPHDNDTSKTKRTKAAHEGTATTMPLRAWPQRGGHYAQVPEILGLDKYAYEVGTHLYARAEMKFTQQLAEEIPRERQLDVPGGENHDPPGIVSNVDQESTCAQECFVGAGRKGNAVILWNRTGHTTDNSRAQLRKRRQKLTEDMLKETVVSYAQPHKVVSSLFSTFEFYCDGPVDVALPPLPEAHDDTAIDEVSPLTKERRSMRSHSTGSLFARPRSESKVQKLVRPRLRQVAGVAPAPRTELNEQLWLRRRKELGKFKFPINESDKKYHQADISELNLEKRCKAECLNSTKFANWMKAYDDDVANSSDAINAAVKKLRVRSTGSGNGSAADDENIGCSKLQTNVAVMKQSLFSGLENMSIFHGSKHDSAETASARSEDNSSSAVSSAGMSDAWVETGLGAQLTPQEVMLRTVSKSLLNSKLLQTSGAGKHQQVQQKKSEAMAERARIIDGVSPVQMTTDNMFRLLALFGLVRRRAGSKIYNFLLKGCPRLTQVKPGNNGLSFEVFFLLMRSLLGDSLKCAASMSRLKAGTCGSQARPTPWEAATPIDDTLWASSDILARLLFSLLTDQTACRDEHAMSRRKADQIGVPFTEKLLAESLRCFLSAPLLREVDYGTMTHGGNLSSSTSDDDDDDDDWPSQLHDEGSSATASRVSNGQLRHSIEESMLLGEIRPSSTRFTSFVECLHWELMQAQTEISAASDECVNTSQRPELCFAAFELWVTKAPDVYASLLHLLLPLMQYGLALSSEEIFLAARGLTQRCGELRARMEVRAQGIQRKQFMKLYINFTKPRCEPFATPAQLA